MAIKFYFSKNIFKLNFFKCKFNKLSKTIFVLFLTVLANLYSTYAEQFTFEEFNFTMDIPEGFYLSESSPNADSFFFETKVMPVKFALKIYSTQKYKDAKSVLQDTLLQLNAKSDIQDVNWFNRSCNLCDFQFVMPDQKLYSGWALSFQVAVKNNSTQKANILLLTYADNQISRDCDQYMLSILDNIYLCKEDFLRAGPITEFAFPKKGQEQIKLNIGKTPIYSTINEEAIQKSKFVLEREYAVLKIYANHPNWKEAWQRYYRQIFRESYSTFENISNDIYKAILPQVKNSTTKDTQVEIVQMLLDWVQDFNYKRDLKNTDFTVPVATILGEGSDCDSRSMVMCLLLEHFGIKSKLFISREYSHAVFGANVNKEGALINVDNVNYVLGETTAKVNFGLIAQEHSDTKKWIEVDLY